MSEIRLNRIQFVPYLLVNNKGHKCRPDPTNAYFGYHLFDDYDSVYCDSMDNIADDNMEFLAQVIHRNRHKECKITQELLSRIVDYRIGISIDGKWYDFEEIKPVLVPKKTSTRELRKHRASGHAAPSYRSHEHGNEQ